MCFSSERQTCRLLPVQERWRRSEGCESSFPIDNGEKQTEKQPKYLLNASSRKIHSFKTVTNPKGTSPRQQTPVNSSG